MDISQDLHLWGCLARLRHEGAFTDVILKTNDGDVAAHRVVLAAHSEYFRARFTTWGEHPSDRHGTNVEIIDLPHLDRVSVESTIEAVYSSHLNVDNESVCGTFACATELAFPAVWRGCEQFMVERLSPETLVDTLNLALLFDNNVLLDSAACRVAAALAARQDQHLWLRALGALDVDTLRRVLSRLAQTDPGPTEPDLGMLSVAVSWCLARAPHRIAHVVPFMAFVRCHVRPGSELSDLVSVGLAALDAPQAETYFRTWGRLLRLHTADPSSVGAGGREWQQGQRPGAAGAADASAVATAATLFLALACLVMPPPRVLSECSGALAGAEAPPAGRGALDQTASSAGACSAGRGPPFSRAVADYIPLAQPLFSVPLGDALAVWADRARARTPEVQASMAWAVRACAAGAHTHGAWSGQGGPGAERTCLGGPGAEGHGMLVACSGAPAGPAEAARVLVLGGNHAGWRLCSGCAAYDPRQDVWETATLPDLTFKVPFPRATSVRGTVIVSGNASCVQRLCAAARLSGGGGDEAAAAAAPLPRWRWYASAAPSAREHHFAAAAEQGRDLWILGGRDSPNTAHSCTLRYEVERERWASGPPLATACYTAAAACCTDALYVAGGQDGRGILTDRNCQWLDSERGWLLAPPLCHPRKYHALVCTRRQLYCVGGKGALGARVREVEAFDPREGCWRVVARLPQGRSSAACAALAGAVVLAGGKDDAGDVLARCDVLCPLTLRCRRVADMPWECSSAGACLFWD